ncbi:hypothetical protein [Sulfurovum sp.]|uniref:hypothetical protein n=1 Tax=Sulfurovum sp. TaxID=1969726 RepID=UPI0025F79FD7|nr:hypothetical protein [Sulfurovum sp.]
MQYYNDKTNRQGTYFAFVAVQLFLLLIVYGFVYTSLVAVKLAVARYHLTFMAYMPVVLALIVYPVVLYKTRKMFRAGKRLRATGWMLGWASVIIVALYAFLSQLIRV